MRSDQMKRGLLVVVSCLLVSACPGALDYDLDYENGYGYQDFGTISRSFYRNIDGAHEPVVGAMVTNYRVKKQYIAAVRKPYFSSADDPAGYFKECEGWFVNMSTHERSGPLNETELAGKMKKAGFKASITFKSCREFR